MADLRFKKISLEDRKAVEEILKEADSMSCQHSFPNLWCLREKYGTELCIRSNVLYIRQMLRGKDGRTAYFLPIGRGAGCGALRAVEQSAKKDGRTFFLFGITEEGRRLTASYLSKRYRIEADRDWYEYIYLADRMRELSGSGLSHRRRDVCAFWRQYGNRAVTEPITRRNLGEVVVFQHWWQREYLKRNQAPGQLEGEHRSILNGLEHFGELGLCGAVIRIDGQIAGFGYGAELGGNSFDIIAQKADYRFRNLNQALFRELAGCRPEAKYINYEEDIGLPGLRQAKLSYKPEFLLQKFCAVPVEDGG